MNAISLADAKARLSELIGLARLRALATGMPVATIDAGERSLLTP